MRSPHPDDQTLKAYGLGKLDDGPASTVNDHLETCAECREKLSGLTSDSFLGRFRAAQQPTARSVFGGSLVDGTVSFLQAKATAAPPSTDTLPPGLANHPDYEIKRELGRGGMGVVYLAHNAMMGRDEVLKVMGRHIMERPGVLERFQREIRAVAKLRHPNIVAAYHAFRIEGGLVFSMEYVEGLDLARLVKAKGPLSVSHAAYFVHQAALGLQHAHEKGLIHRDIKPHNLMLTHDGKARLVKVLDFGLAKATREEKVDAGLTSEGQALGTPDYIAPEQITNAPDVDIRADLYSLGGTLFYLLTGRPPFQATSLYDIYQAHMSRDVEPLNLIRPEVPAELAALVAKMMAKEPKRRFQTPAEVAQALTPYFKKVTSPPRSSKGEIAQPVPPITSRPATESVRSPAREKTASENHRVPSRKAMEPIEQKSLWNGLIEDRPDTSATLRPTPWASKTVVIAATLFVLVALGVIVIKIQRDDGRELKITIENTRSGKGKTVTEPIRREIPTHPAEIVRSVPPTSQFVPLFNGKNLEGWTNFLRNGSQWNVADGGILEGRGGGDGNPAVLFSDRQDFTNFRLRAKLRYSQGAGGSIGLRHKANGQRLSGYFVSDSINPSQPNSPMGSVSYAANYLHGTPLVYSFKTELDSQSLNTWYTMDISVIGDRVSTSVDGKELIDVYVDKRCRSGGITLSCAGPATIQFQEVLIQILSNTDVEPEKVPRSLDGAGEPESSPLLVRTVSSRFAPNDTEGWYTRNQDGSRDATMSFLVDTGEGKAWLLADDQKNGKEWGWHAPPKFHGDHSDKFGRLLEFSIFTTGSSSPRSHWYVRLDGGGKTLFIDGTTAEPPVAMQWKKYEIRLDASGGWKVAGRLGGKATDDDLKQTLSDITDLRFKGEYAFGNRGCLDDVVLGAGK